jgi:GT2 family glycosyltransferase
MDAAFIYTYGLIMQTRHVNIIIVNYQRWEDTRDCIASIIESTHRDFSIFVVDNNSGNDSLQHVSNWLIKGGQNLESDAIATDVVIVPINELSDLKRKRINLVQNEKNEGFAIANNRVLRSLAARDEFVWLLNPDMIIEKDSMQKLVQFADQQLNDYAIGVELHFAGGNRQLLFYGGGHVNLLSATVRPNLSKGKMKGFDYISGTSLFAPLSVFEQFGYLPENYFLYWEETDWCYGAKQKGLRLLLCPDTVCYDKISTVVGKGFLANYYYCRNGLWFVKKYHRAILPFTIVIVAFRYMKRIFLGQWSRAKGLRRGLIDFLKGKQDAYQ